MGQTISEKIFSTHAGGTAGAGDYVVASVDCCMGTDGSSPLAIHCFQEMGGTKLFDPGRVVFSLDHYAPSPNEKVSLIHQGIAAFAERHGARLHGVGAGISHQLMVEQGHVLPGMLVFGADSHSCTYGAVNAFASGIGSSDLAAIMISGQLWFQVPPSIRIRLDGICPAGLYPKDIILWVFGRLGALARDCAIEFSGTAVDAMDVDSRLTLSNMVTDIGAVAGLMACDGKTRDWLAARSSAPYTPVAADDDAVYAADLSWDVSDISPQIALPHNPDNVVDIDAAAGTAIDQVFVGTCTNGRLEDLRVVGDFLRRHDLNPKTRMIIGPASRDIYAQAASEGLLGLFAEKGAIVITPGCGPCCGTGNGVPAEGETVLTTMNRNFKGRMGNVNADIYLGSPASAAAAAITGVITDPRLLA